MKLPLLVHAKPRILVGPSVQVEKGNYILEAKDLIDSIVDLCLDDGSSHRVPVTNNKEVELKSDTKVHIEIVKPGKESQLTVYIGRV